MNYIDKEWAELERRSEKIDKVEKIVPDYFRLGNGNILFLILGKAGASDCGAPWEEIFPVNIYLLWIDDPIVSYMGVR